MKNIFSSIPEPIQEEIFEDLLKTDSIRIERILSRGQSSSRHWVTWTDPDRVTVWLAVFYSG